MSAEGTRREIHHALTTLGCEVLASPLGTLTVVSSNVGICAIEYQNYSARMQACLTRRFGAFDLVPVHDAFSCATALAAYFAGECGALDGVVVDAGGTAFQGRVWAALRTIPAARPCSYGELAAQLGLAPASARAVGHANSLNPVAIVVPCHRVIGADASLTGYAGGLERKRWLLEHERAHAGAPTLFGTILA
jgi:methylated-DNA-[protein]-cysteine S-methyltransferase